MGVEGRRVRARGGLAHYGLAIPCAHAGMPMVSSTEKRRLWRDGRERGGRQAIDGLIWMAYFVLVLVRVPSLLCGNTLLGRHHVYCCTFNIVTQCHVSFSIVNYQPRHRVNYTAGRGLPYATQYVQEVVRGITLA